MIELAIFVSGGAFMALMIFLSYLIFTHRRGNSSAVGEVVKGLREPVWKSSISQPVFYNELGSIVEPDRVDVLENATTLKDVLGE